VLVSAWRVLENKIATRINLEKRGIMVDSLLCCLCGLEEKYCHHLFFKCKIVWDFWSQCFVWLGVSFVSHNDPILNFHQFRMCNASATVNEVWGTVWIVVVSEIWKHMNKVIFKGGVVDIVKMFVMAQLNVWSWLTSKLTYAIFSYSDGCFDLLACMRMV